MRNVMIRSALLATYPEPTPVLLSGDLACRWRWMSCGFINLDVAGASLDLLVVPYEHDVGVYVLRRG